MRRPWVVFAVFVVASVGVACTTKPEPSSGPPSAANPEPSPSPASDESRERIEIDAGAAEAVGLPPLGFSLSIAGTGMSGAELRDGDYLHLSGPPGGPLSLRIAPAKLGAELRTLVAGVDADATAAASLVATEVELVGERRPALAWVSGESLAQTSWCATIIAPPGAKAGDPALLLIAGVGGPEPDCASVVSHVSLAKVLASFELEAGE